MVGVSWFVASIFIAAGSGIAAEPPGGPLHIVGGQEALACEWPSVVAILEDDETPVMCSGTLIHPDVVSTAAHCITAARPVVAVGFGEEGQGKVGPVRTVAVSECVAHPQYDQLGYPDIAYCILSESVTDVPIVPLLAGCETDLLVAGGEVTIVGYGSSYGTYENGEVSATGVGPKRWITQTLDEVDPDIDEVHMVGENGSQSACFGDSGGPAMVQLADGTWRVFGAASRLYDPGGFPPPLEEGNVCGIGVTYGFLSTQQSWLESETARDLTPCHDDDGNWSPSANCTTFPSSPNTGFGTWANGCSGGPQAGGEPQCEDVVGTTSGGESSSSGGPQTSSGESGLDSGPGSTTSASTTGASTTSASTTGASTTGTTTSGTTTPGSGTTGPIPLPPDDDSVSGGTAGDTDTDPAQEGSGLAGRGCSCSAAGNESPPAATVLLLGLFGLGGRSSRRRRRPPSR